MGVLIFGDWEYLFLSLLFQARRKVVGGKGRFCLGLAGTDWHSVPRIPIHEIRDLSIIIKIKYNNGEHQLTWRLSLISSIIVVKWTTQSVKRINVGRLQRDTGRSSSTAFFLDSAHFLGNFSHWIIVTALFGNNSFHGCVLEMTGTNHCFYSSLGDMRDSDFRHMLVSFPTTLSTTYRCYRPGGDPIVSVFLNSTV